MEAKTPIEIISDQEVSVDQQTLPEKSEPKKIEKEVQPDEPSDENKVKPNMIVIDKKEKTLPIKKSDIILNEQELKKKMDAILKDPNLQEPPDVPLPNLSSSLSVKKRLLNIQNYISALEYVLFI